MSEIVWTPERVELLRRLAAEKLTGAAIAQRFGCSRNAILGKAHRLKLQLAGAVTPAVLAARQQKRREQEEQARRGAEQRAAQAERRAQQIEAARETPPAAFDPLPADSAPVAEEPAFDWAGRITTFDRAVDEKLCLYFACEAHAPDGPDMPVCGHPRDPDARNRYCRGHNARLRGMGHAEYAAFVAARPSMGRRTRTGRWTAGEVAA
jgi:hypothetical protein